MRGNYAMEGEKRVATVQHFVADPFVRKAENPVFQGIIQGVNGGWRRA